jgi:hypothetical protein
VTSFRSILNNRKRTQISTPNNQAYRVRLELVPYYFEANKRSVSLGKFKEFSVYSSISLLINIYGFVFFFMLLSPYSCKVRSIYKFPSVFCECNKGNKKWEINNSCQAVCVCVIHNIFQICVGVYIIVFTHCVNNTSGARSHMTGTRDLA